MTLPSTVSKSVLKAKMLEIFRELEKSQGELIVTDNNEPVLRITPIKKKRSPKEVFHNVKVTYSEPIESPTESEWEDT